MADEAERRRLARKERRHSRAREELLDAARLVLERDGVAGFTVKAIAAEADVSKPAFYYYFPSREHCVEALADGILAREATVLSAAAYRAADAASVPGEVVRAFVDLYADDLDSFRIAWEWPALIGATEGFSARVVHPRRSQMLDVLVQRLREFKDPLDIAELTLATAHGLLAGDTAPNRRRSLARVAGQTLAAALRTPGD